MLRRESNKDWMKGQIASSLPGRLRLRVEGLGFLFDARMDVAGELATIAGVRRVQVTPCTGSVLLEYDQNKLDWAALADCADLVVALYAIIIPLLTLGVLRSLGRISDYRIDDRSERLLPLLVGAVCYVLCAITIAKIPSAIFLRKFMIAAACCEVMCLVVSLYWKISLHLTAMGAVVALLVVMNIAGVGDMMVPLMIAILCAGALASARLYLGCHNGQQVLAGFCGGFAVSVLAVLFL